MSLYHVFKAIYNEHVSQSDNRVELVQLQNSGMHPEKIIKIMNKKALREEKFLSNYRKRKLSSPTRTSDDESASTSQQSAV